jgi:2'-hydroxyisoflavone reductase
MHVLILGGTRFIGLHMTEALLAAGHTVDVFSRGRTPAPAGTRHLHGDRDGDLSALEGGRWDVVVDVSGYLPRQVRTAAELLSGRARRYLFVSTAAVYEAGSPEQLALRVPLAENAPLKPMPAPDVEEITAATYGPLKVACEHTAAEAFDGEVLSLRPTFVVGPADYTDRFTSWLRRVRRGGRVAAPIDPDLPLAFVDARDLSRFTVRLAEGDATGAVNVTGPAAPTSWGAVLDVARDVAGSDAKFTWLPEAFLREQGVFPERFPMVSAFTFRGKRPFAMELAAALGLEHTDVADTVRDTLAWHDAHGEATAGLSHEDETRLLETWDARASG